MGSPGMTGPAKREQGPRPLLRTTLGDVLRRTRLEQGWTLADVARAARVSMPYLSELERGRKEGSSEILAAICGALRIELSDLLAEAGRDLAGQQARVIRMDAVRSARVSPQDRVSPAPVSPQTARVLPQAGGPGDVVCLLAA